MPLNDLLTSAIKLHKARRFVEAEALYRQRLATHPLEPNTLHMLGLTRMEQGDDEQATDYMEKALELSPEVFHFHYNISGLYRSLGRFKDAENRLRHAIRLKPDHGESFQALAELIHIKADDPMIELIKDQLKLKECSDSNRCYFHFAAAKAFDDIGDAALAFSHLQQANQLAGRSFDSIGFRSYIKDILYIFSQTWIQSLTGLGSDSEVPTFIVGMPRSGTSLIEQILSSHSKVFGAGELKNMAETVAHTTQLSTLDAGYPSSLRGVSNTQYTVIANRYLKQIKSLAGDRKVDRIIDKQPLNFQFIGLILTMFPNAKIIHAVRNPLDTCLSCYFQHFSSGHDYSFDLGSLGHYYNDYQRVMEHWENLYEDKIYTVSYERLIADQAKETSNLLAFLGLEFETQCLDFHQTNRNVNTASFRQVRQPIYPTSQSRWLRYKKELAELAEILGIAQAKT